MPSSAPHRPTRSVRQRRLREAGGSDDFDAEELRSAGNELFGNLRCLNVIESVDLLTRLPKESNALERHCRIMSKPIPNPIEPASKKVPYFHVFCRCELRQSPHLNQGFRHGIDTTKLNRSGFLGDSIPWKGRWRHAGEAVHAALHTR